MGANGVSHLEPFWAPSRIVGSLQLLITAAVSAYVCAWALAFVRTYRKKPEHFKPVTLTELLFRPSAAVPVVQVFNGDFEAALAAGSQLYPDRAYKITHFSDEIVIIPPKDIDRIKEGPASKLSFQQAAYDVFMGRLTGITDHDEAMSSLIRRDLGRLLDRVYDIVEDEAVLAIEKELGPCKEWTAVTAMPKVVRIVISISQRVFVGEPLCQNHEWIRAVVDCTSDASRSVPVLWNYGWITRPFVAWWLPALRNIRRQRKEAKRLLKSVLDERLLEMESPDFTPRADLIQLILDGIEGKGRSLDYQLNALIAISRASLNTTGATIAHLIYDLAAHPEYIEPLREEVLSLGDARLSRASVAKLDKMDSFIRESQRWNKFILVGTIRKVLKPLQLSDGTVLPVGTVLGVNKREAVFKHTNLENPEVFDGLRFYKQRAQPGNQKKFQAVATGPDHLVFGYGPQACPGRFFAVHEIKVVLALILSRYEFKLSKRVESPMSRVVGIMTQADGSVEYMFRRLGD